jgi:hypothetical protein
MRPEMLFTAIAAVASPATALPACPTYPLSSTGVAAAERAWVEAIENGDRTALSCILDPAFLDSNWKGQIITREQMLDRVAHKPRPVLKLSDLHVTLHGQAAVVRGINTQSFSGQSAAVRFTDVFIYRGGRWRAVAAQETVVRQ